MSGTRLTFELDAAYRPLEPVEFAPGGSMLDGENYRKKALDCVLTAYKARDPGVRLAFLKLARNYVALADYLDAHGAAQDKQKDN